MQAAGEGGGGRCGSRGRSMEASKARCASVRPSVSSSSGLEIGTGGQLEGCAGL